MTDDAPVIDTSVPHSARIWNYWLGGRDHYEVDRAAGERYRTTFPGIVDLARASRDFRIRSVRHLAGEAGIRQFLDIGTGLPAAGSTHETAQAVAPEARIVYVDNDPLVLAHARALLTSGPAGVTDYIHADLREPAAILAAAVRTLDFGEPVGLILSGVLGHIDSYRRARAIVAELIEALAAGSHLSLNDGTSVISRAIRRAQRDYNASGAVPYHLRSPEEIGGFFAGLDLIEPGLVSCPLWRPARVPAVAEGCGEPGPEHAVDIFGGVGRKP
ncbi:SAM-dependent methyltransferase [Streptomyces hoynatensis]|uniref:SAM-dependent methyltransferase n=1 Tax=Streptomyces hoynatensis TaxID=1141874 RepID=UPI001574F51C|nr:SAM-dependent methyltransferase [Streptomyces hoynatensis]